MIIYVLITTVTISTFSFSLTFRSGRCWARVSEMWDEQVRTKGVDEHEEDQISFGDALARACLQRSAESLHAGPSIHPEAWFSEKVLSEEDANPAQGDPDCEGGGVRRLPGGMKRIMQGTRYSEGEALAFSKKSP